MSATAAPVATDSAFTAFLRGLREPSGLSLVLALAIAFVPFAAMTVLVDEEFLASPRGAVFALGPRDAGHHLTANLLDVRLHPPAGPQVYVFGASTVRNGVDVERLGRALGDSVGLPVRVVGMASGLQRPIEALAMVEALPPEAYGVVVVGVGAPSLAYDADHLRSLVEAPRVGLRLERLESEARAAGIDVPARSRWHFWDNRRYLLPRVVPALRHVFRGRPRWVAMPQHGRRAPDPRTLDKLFGLALGRFEVDERARAESLRVLDLLVAAIRARPRMRLVLLEDTIHPAHRERPEYARAVDTFRGIVGPYARERGVPFLQLQAGARIAADDFADAVHLRSPEAAGRFTDALAGAIAPLVREVAQPPR